jgi:DDE superfamily endonuclease
LTLWFQDEARFGQKGRVCHRWFTRGQRPPGLCDQRYTWAHLFAAVRPATGQSFALVLPDLSTEAMQVFLDMFAATLAPDEHAALVADQAGWHIANALRVPDNVTLVYLPSYSPELTWGKSGQGNSWSRRHDFMLLRLCQIRGPSHSM